jgi:hypothetical protein
LRLVPVVVLLAACGGSASRNPSSSADDNQTAGEAGLDTGGSNVGVPAQGGTASGAPTAGAGGVAGSTAGDGGASASGANGGEAEAGGQPSSSCVGLDCLAGAELVYWPDREWQRGSAPGAAGELPEAEYQPKMGLAWDVKVSSDARQIVLTPRAGGDEVHGVRDVQHTDQAWFELALAIGGRFLVNGALPAFQAEYTAYGSGVPIVSSTRGTLAPP